MTRRSPASIGLIAERRSTANTVPGCGIAPLLNGNEPLDAMRALTAVTNLADVQLTNK
jgi:hypothetical protein